MLMTLPSLFSSLAKGKPKDRSKGPARRMVFRRNKYAETPESNDEILMLNQREEVDGPRAVTRFKNSASMAIKDLLMPVVAAEDVWDGTPFPFLDLAAELREQIYEYLVISPYPLKKADQESHDSCTQLTQGLNLRLVNKQMAEEVAAVFFKRNTFTINHIEDLPSSLTGRNSLRRLQMVYPLDTVLLPRYIADSKNLRYICIKAERTVLDINAAHSDWLVASLQVLNYEDGGLKFLSGRFYDSFRVHGKRGGVRGEIAKGFIEGCQVECSRIARLGLCRFPMEEFVIEGVRVGIEFTLEGITTVRIL